MCLAETKSSPDQTSLKHIHRFHILVGIARFTSFLKEKGGKIVIFHLHIYGNK